MTTDFLITIMADGKPIDVFRALKPKDDLPNTNTRIAEKLSNYLLKKFLC